MKKIKNELRNFIPEKYTHTYRTRINKITNEINAGNVDDVLEELTSLIELYPKDSELHYLLGSAFNEKKRWVLAFESLSEAIELGHSQTVEVVDEYILAAERMEKFESVIGILLHRKKLRGKLSKKHMYILSTSYLSINDEDSALEIAEQVIQQVDLESYLQLAVNDKNWIYAIFILKSQINNSSKEEAWMYNQLANSYHMIFDYEKALDAVEKAIELEPMAEHYELLAAIAEDKGDFKKALEAYNSFNFDNSKIRKTYLYRVAYTNYRLENYEEACKLWKEFAKTNNMRNYELKTNASYVAALKIAKTDKYKAIELLKCALTEQNKNNAHLYAQIAGLYEEIGNLEEAAHHYNHMRIQSNRVGSFGRALKSQYQRYTAHYSVMYDELPIDENAIVYSSLNGINFSSNPLAIFQHMSKETKYHHYIAVSDSAFISEELVLNDNVTIIKYNSEMHLRQLATAKYIITDTSFNQLFTPKKGQKILNTWHGTPVKCIGLDLSTNKYSITQNLSKGFRVSTHIITQNQFMEDKIISSHTLDRYNQTKFKVTGYPRQDLLLNISEARKNKIKEYLGIPDGKKIVMYAPTFRGEGSKVDKRADNMMWEAAETLRKLDNIHLLYKPHHYSSGADSRLDYFDTNELLAIVDVLISDYSSIAIDYLVKDCPIIYYVFDQIEYKSERGLYFNTDEISDHSYEDLDNVVSVLQDLVETPTIGPKQQEAKKRFCPLDDGKASERVVDFFFNENSQLEVDNKKNILMFAGNLSITNGLTRSFENLVNKLSSDSNKITVIVGESTVDNETSNEMLDRLYAKGHKIIVKFGRDLINAKEEYARGYFEKHRHLPTQEIQKIHDFGYERNVMKVFGNQKYDVVINFESGYSTNMHILLTKLQANTKILVLHSDMKSESLVRMPHLKQSFAYYNKYDHILTVSQSVCNENIANLKDEYNIDSSKFGVLNNVIDFTHITNLAAKPLEVPEDEKYFESDGKVFISVGRFSIEKNHELAIKCFQQVIKNKKYKKSKLLLMGHGPLEDKTRLLIKKLKLENNVIVLGQRSNPYNYLLKSDCFLFPSLHEGQPLVLFEAMITDTPIIASNIPPNIEFIDKYGGVYTENNIEDYTRAIENYLENGIEWKGKFVGEQYNQGIINQLLDLFEN